jgi:hypothetical protein
MIQELDHVAGYRPCRVSGVAVTSDFNGILCTLIVVIDPRFIGLAISKHVWCNDTIPTKRSEVLDLVAPAIPKVWEPVNQDHRDSTFIS